MGHMVGGEDTLLESAPGRFRPDIENTRSLVTRARAGDRDAANEIFVRYEERIRRIVRVRLGSGLRIWTESGDVVQEVCRSALEGFDQLDVGSEFDLLDWLARVATHKIRDIADFAHAKKRDVRRVSPLEPTRNEQSGVGLVPPCSGPTPSNQAFRSEVRALLDEVVASLPESYREVILLRDYEGAEWPDVARALATPSLHAAQQLHQRAWIKVRAAAAPRLTGLSKA
jgi:RNA polymerase sigma-70 factor (ECF subfamily)